VDVKAALARGIPQIRIVANEGAIPRLFLTPYQRSGQLIRIAAPNLETIQGFFGHIPDFVPWLDFQPDSYFIPE
jgi:hypothetical protein